LRVAIKEKGLFHTKAWLFDLPEGRVVIHGSANATESGLVSNFEQLTVNFEFENGEEDEVVRELSSRFDAIWRGEYEGIKSAPLTRRTLSAMTRIKESLARRGIDDDQLVNRMCEDLESVNEPREPLRLKVPNWLNYRSGDFSHQGEALDAWIKNGGKGILSIATGGGKTLTALTAATLIQGDEDRLLVIIGVPTTPLIDQWRGEVQQFDINPLQGTGLSLRQLAQAVRERVRNLQSGYSRTEVLIITHDALKSPEMLGALEDAAESVALMLVGDEVHNLGSPGFKEIAPSCIKYRLGLSATVERQYDALGTKFLYDYFGGVVFEFSLEDAIGKCLVPFKYYVHKVMLSEEEKDEWLELSEKIRQLNYAAELSDGSPDKEKWKLLCVKRRRIVESASAKVNKFEEVLPAARANIKRTLVFCTDKNPRQLEDVNRVLNERGVNFHQITQEETRDRKRLASIIDAFGRDEYQVLTSKRVLDEGFNVPQTEVAYLLANNTIKRQWVQRLGRILRKSPETDKAYAIIHDFVIVPSGKPGNRDADLRSLISGEINRLQYFNSLSSNGFEASGAFDVIDELTHYLEER